MLQLEPSMHERLAKRHTSAIIFITSEQIGEHYAGWTCILTANYAEAMPRIVEEQLSCSLRLQGFLPIHSDLQRFVRVVIWEALTPAMTQKV